MALARNGTGIANIIPGQRGRILSYVSPDGRACPLVVSVQPRHEDTDPAPAIDAAARISWSCGNAPNSLVADVGCGITFGLSAEEIVIDVETANLTGAVAPAAVQFSGFVTPGSGPSATLQRTISLGLIAAGATSARQRIPAGARSMIVLATPGPVSPFIIARSWSDNPIVGPLAQAMGPGGELALTARDRFFSVENGDVIGQTLLAVFALQL